MEQVMVWRKRDKVCVVMHVNETCDAVCLLTVAEVRELQDRLTRATLEIFARKFLSEDGEGEGGAVCGGK